MRRLLLSLLVTTSAVLFLSIPAMAQNVVTDPACGVGGTGGSAYCQQSGSNPIVGPNGLITKVINIISYIAGIAAVIMVIISGIMFVNSHGDSNSVKTARNTLMYAIIGLIIVVIAQTLVRFVLSRVVK